MAAWDVPDCGVRPEPRVPHVGIGQIEHLGYVPRSMNTGLARELDAGHSFVAVLAFDRE